MFVFNEISKFHMVKKERVTRAEEHTEDCNN